MARLLVKGAIWAAAIALLVVTATPLARGDAWWIRMWDFPRFQIALLLVPAIVAATLLLDRRHWSTRALLGALVLALGYQTARMWPYTPFGTVQAETALSCPEPSRLRLLTGNVLMTNRNAGPLLDLLRSTEPDLVLLVETDAWWAEQLAPLRSSYPFVISHPRGDTYGLYLLSRFPLVNPQVRFHIDEYVPSLRTGVRLPSGALIDFHGVHPKPPPLQDTTRRDAELLITAFEVRETTDRPSIVAGDLNDVAWSRTTHLFQEIGGLLDPRRGRGFYPTYNANWPGLRWPLDHVFFEPAFRLTGLGVLSDIGSDHLPLRVDLCYAPDAADGQRRPAPEDGDLEAAREAIAAGRAKAQRTRERSL